MEAAWQAEKRGGYGKAAGLALEALITRSQLSTEVKTAVPVIQRKLVLSVVLVLYSWAFRFIRESNSDLAFSVLKTLSSITSSKSVLLFQAKRTWRTRVMTLFAWYYSRVSKFHAAMDYIDLAKQQQGEQTALDRVVLVMLEGFVLSNLNNFKEAVSAHSAAHQLLSSLPRDPPALEDMVLCTCLCVSLFNLAADNRNLYQPLEAQQYIHSASHLATSCLPSGSFTRDKIRALYEELVGKPDELKPVDGPSLRTVSGTGKRQIVTQAYGSNFRIPILRPSRRYSSSIRQRPSNNNSARPTSASIMPASPPNSKSVSVKPHRRRRFLREKSIEEYEAMERILRERAEIRFVSPEDPRPQLSERPLQTEERSLFTAGKGARRLVHLAARPSGADIVKAVKVKIARVAVATYRICLRNVKEIALRLHCTRSVRSVSSVLRKIHRKRHVAASLIQRCTKGFICRRYISRLIAAYDTIHRVAMHCVVTEMCKGLQSGRRKDIEAVLRWQRVAYSLSSRVLATTVSKEMKDLSESLKTGNVESTEAFTTVTSRAETGHVEMYSEEWMLLVKGGGDLYRKTKEMTAFQGWKSICACAKQRQSAIKLQSFLRMALTRKRYLSFLRVVTFLQTHLRAWRFRSKTSAAVRIQRHYRGFRARQAASRLLQSVLVVQRYVRGFLARRVVIRRNYLAKSIQRAAKKHYKWLHALKS